MYTHLSPFSFLKGAIAHEEWEAVQKKEISGAGLLYSFYMSERERRPRPQWAERERTQDLAWIGKNLQEFWKVARSGFEVEGRGALVIDMVAMVTGTGHQFGYILEKQIRQFGGTDEIRMVAAYDPSWELVILLLKPQDRMSSYRIGIPGQQSKPRSR